MRKDRTNFVKPLVLALALAASGAVAQTATMEPGYYIKIDPEQIMHITADVQPPKPLPVDRCEGQTIEECCGRFPNMEICPEIIPPDPVDPEEPINAQAVEVVIDGPTLTGDLFDYTTGPAERFRHATSHPPQAGTVVIERGGAFTYTKGDKFKCPDGDMFGFVAENSFSQSDKGFVRLICPGAVVPPPPPPDPIPVEPPIGDLCEGLSDEQCCEEYPDSEGCEVVTPPPVTETFPEAPRVYTPDYRETDSAPELRTDYPADLAVYKKPEGETLEAALTKLKAQTKGRGGIIEFTSVNQCDNLRVAADLVVEYLVLRGIDSEHDFLIDGKPVKKIAQPRIYCRSDDPRAGGTIPLEFIKKHAAQFFAGGGPNPQVWFENFEIDGFNKIVSLGDTGIFEFRRFYGHSGFNDGISSSNSGNHNADDGFLASLYRDQCNLRLTFWRTELSHWGQGNFKHNAYTHGCFGGAAGTDIVQQLKETFGPDFELPGVFPEHRVRVTLADSVWHSPRWASVFKSISDEINIINSKLCTTASVCGIDDGLPRDTSQAVIDIAAMADVTIRDSEIICYKNGQEGGGICAAARSRKTALRGARTPVVWWPYHREYVYTADGTKYREIPERLIPDSPIHTEEFWTKLNGQKWFTWTFKNTHFKQIIEPGTGRENPAITVHPTAWLFDGGRGNNACRIPMPVTAYELVEYLIYPDVTFEGFAENVWVYKGFGHEDRCIYPMPTEYPTGASFKRFGVVRYVEAE